jgi:hypothetical protein
MERAISTYFSHLQRMTKAVDSVHHGYTSLGFGTKELLWNNGRSAEIQLECVKNIVASSTRSLSSLLPRAGAELIVIGNGASSQGISRYIDAHPAATVVRFNDYSKDPIYRVGAKVDIHVVNAWTKLPDAPVVLVLECSHQSWGHYNVSRRATKSSLVCQPKPKYLTAMCKTNPSRGFLFLSLARTAHTTISGFDNVKPGTNNHYYGKPTDTYHEMNAEHNIISGDKRIKRFNAA